MGSTVSLTGWHTQNSLNAEGFDEGVRVIEYNALRVCGYFPIVGIFIGARNIHIAWINKLSPVSVRVYLVARGILEILGLGFLFLIPDVAVSLYRFCKPHTEAPVLLPVPDSDTN